MRRRKLIIVASAAARVFLVSWFGVSRKPPLVLSFVSTEVPPEAAYIGAKFSLSNCSSRTWTYRDSSIPDRLWRIKVKVNGHWKDGQMHAGYFQTIGWSREEKIRPGESRIIGLVLPSDGVERSVGAFVQQDGLRTSKPMVLVRDFYYRLFHRSILLPGQFCAWSTNTFSNRALIERGLLATNEFARMTFDQAGWKKGSAQEKVAMGNEMVLSRLLNGKTKSQILELLGPARGFQEDGGFWSLGYQQLSPVYFPEERILSVRLDGQGRVNQAEIIPIY